MRCFRFVFFDEYCCKVVNLKLNFVESVICDEVWMCRAYVHFSLKPCNKLLFEELPVNFDCSWSGLRFICRIVSVFKVVWELNLVTLQIIGSFEVAHWIELRKVAEFIHDEFEKRPFDFVCDVMKLWKLMCIFLY